MSLPGSESSQLPPLSAAMSTMTDPSAMRSTMAVVTRTGAWRPGTAAVVITTSAAATSLLISSRWRARKSSDCTRAYPPAPSWDSSSSSTKVAPRDCTSSLAAARTS